MHEGGVSMGGRGASSGSGGVAKELRATKNTISLDEYLARQGLSEGVSGYADDKIRSNRTTITSRGRKRFDQG